MTSDDDFEPRLGRQRSKGKGRSAKPVLHRILAAATLARGGTWTGARRGFSGSRIGRGAGAGCVLASRDRFAAFRSRRVLVKARIVRLKGKGLDGAKAHLRYTQRDGTTRDGGRGELYGAERDQVDRSEFIERGRGDRHQFRFIVSAEDGAEYDDLKPLTRRLMARVEEDLGTKLDWVAVDHFNTGHPHTHIVVRGKDGAGKDLVIARDYIRTGMRERACELVDLDLGPRDDLAIRHKLSQEVTQERLTAIDRMLVRGADANGFVVVADDDPFYHAIRIGRLRQLQRLGLAEPDGSGWRLLPQLSDTLRRIGEQGDIIRTMQRVYSGRGRATPPPIDQVIHAPAAGSDRPLVGRVVARGLADELDDRHYLIVEATDGRSHYVEIGRGENVPALAEGAIIRIEPQFAGVREVDRTIARVAEKTGGHYTVDLHLSQDPSATDDFAQAHVRRLEAMRRLTGAVERGANGAWIISSDHLDKAAAYEARRLRDAPVKVELLSPVPVERLVAADAPTWLDIELASSSPEPLRGAGFGQAAVQAKAERRAWLVAQDLAREEAGVARYPADLLATLRRRELLRVAGQLSEELGIPFVEPRPGLRIEGVCKRSVDLAGGRYALIERSREFTLVPWRPVLERQIGKSVSGLMRDAGVSWTFGRERSGPSIS